MNKIDQSNVMSHDGYFEVNLPIDLTSSTILKKKQNTIQNTIQDTIIDSDYTKSKEQIEFDGSKLWSLDIPCKNIFAENLFNIINTLSLIQSTFLNMSDDLIQSVRNDYKNDMQKKIDQNRDLVNLNKWCDFFDVLKKITTCVLSVVSIAVGGAFIAGAVSVYAAIGGGALVLSGSASILGIMLSSMKSDTRVVSILNIISMVAGIIGFASFSIRELTGKILITAITIVNNLSEVAKHSYMIEISNLKSSNDLTNSSFEQKKINIQTLVKSVDFLNEEISNHITTCAEILIKREGEITRINAISRSTV